MGLTFKQRYYQNTKEAHAVRLKQWRIDHPYEYAYQTLKDNGKRRRIRVTISFEDFKEWAIENKYIELKGRYGHNATIDRVIDEYPHGYDKGNLQIKTRSENTIKENDKRKMLKGTWKPFECETF